MAKLNHIGIAVSDLPEMKKLFLLLGVTTTHAEDVPGQGVRTHFLPLSDDTEGTNIELLEPISDGAVAKFLKKHGPGFHHMAFSVPKGELHKLCSKLRAEGYRLIYDKPETGAHGMKINFIHPASAGGILIEIMEPA